MHCAQSSLAPTTNDRMLKVLHINSIEAASTGDSDAELLFAVIAIDWLRLSARSKTEHSRRHYVSRKRHSSWKDFKLSPYTRAWQARSALKVANIQGGGSSVQRRQQSEYVEIEGGKIALAPFLAVRWVNEIPEGRIFDRQHCLALCLIKSHVSVCAETMSGKKSQLK